MSDRLLTLKEAANYLKVHWQTVRSYIKSNKLKATKVGKNIRILESDLEALALGKKKEEKPNEVEIRFIVKDRKKLEERIIDTGARVVYHGHVIDHWFVPNEIKNIKEKNESFESGKGFGLRIREQDNGYTGRVTASIEIKRLVTPFDHTVCLEEEVIIENYDQALRLLNLMNNKEFSTVDKDRVVYKLGDIKIVIDDIKGYKTAVELEIMAKVTDKEARGKLDKLAKKIGLTNEQDVTSKSATYLYMQENSRF